MKLFVTGEQESSFINETLDELLETFNVSIVVGSACSPCMSDVRVWCEYNEIPISLYLPDTMDEIGVIQCNLDVIKKERPKFLLLYNETSSMQKSICDLAKNTPSIEFIAKKSEK